MIEIYWGGKLYRFASEKEALEAGFHTEIPANVPEVESPSCAKIPKA